MVCFIEKLRLAPSGSHQMGVLCGVCEESVCMCERESELEREEEHVCAHIKGQSVRANADDAACRGRRCWFWLSFLCYEISLSKH